MGQFQDTIFHEHPVVIRDVTAAQFAAQAVGAPKNPGIRYRVDGGAEYQWNGSAWVAMVTAQQSVTGGVEKVTAAGVSVGLPLNQFRKTDFSAVDASNTTTYSDWINKVESDILTSAVEKIDLGASADGTNHIYAYKAGYGAIRVALISGIHGAEVVGQFAALEFFRNFIGSDDVVFANLRDAITIIYVPTLSPSAWRSSRKNSNSVDPNRNFPFYWSRYTPESSDYAKGSAALDQPEAVAAKTLIDNYDCVAVVDCHNTEADLLSSDVAYVAPAIAALSRRELVYITKSVFEQNYDTTTEALQSITSVFPTLTNWSAFYNMNRARYHCASVTVECNENLDGSSSTALTASAATKYCGFILTWLQVFARSIGSPITIPYHSWGAIRVAEATGTSIASGGTLIDVTTATPVTFDTFSPQPAPGTRNYIDSILVSPGVLEVKFDGYFESSGTGTQRVDIGISKDGELDNGAHTSVMVPATAGERVGFSTSIRFAFSSIDGSYIPRIAGTIAKGGTSVQNPKLKRCRMFVRFIPSLEIERTPVI